VRRKQLRQGLAARASRSVTSSGGSPAVGDAGVVASASSTPATSCPTSPPNHRVAPSPEIVPVTQPVFIDNFAEFLPNYVGEYARDRQFPLRRMLDDGWPISGSCDV
jgi:hypothetical protein